MTRKKLNSMKRAAAKNLILGTLMAIIATIPVVFHWDNDITGSVFCWTLSAMVIHDSITKLIKLNRIG